MKYIIYETDPNNQVSIFALIMACIFCIVGVAGNSLTIIALLREFLKKFGTCTLELAKN